MELLIVFNTSILPLFIVIAVALFYDRLAHPDISQIANLATMVFGPVFVFNALMKHEFTATMLIKPIIFMILLTILLMLLAHLVGRAIKAKEDERITLILASSMINVGNFGLPLIYFSYGSEADAYSVLYLIAFNIPLSTVAIYLSSKEKEIKKVLLDIGKIPIFYALVAAVVVGEFAISIPKPLYQSIELMGGAAIPLLIFTLGLQLSHTRLRFRYFKILIPGILIRLVVSPFIAWGLLTWMEFPDPALKIAMVQTSAPAALLPLMYAIRFDRSPDLLAAMIMLTTVISGFTLTLLIKILG
jgi:predicted permease